MEKIVIEGQHKLKGEVVISGAKNAAVAIIAGTILVKDTCRIENIPNISDVYLYLDILKQIGAKVNFVNKTTVEINCKGVRNVNPPYELVKKMRASSYLIGALLGRFNKAQVGMPGGCDFGVRPIDQHIKGFEILGATVNIEHGGNIKAEAQELCGAKVYFDKVSVGATINVMLAAVLAKGVTILENAAKEPHIVDLANFLNSMGADVKGAGTDVIKIYGVPELHGGSYSIIPDQIEAGTFMIMAGVVPGSEVLIKNIIPKHMDCITAKLLEIGVTVEENDDSLRVIRSQDIQKTNVKAMPYPGFPTDMQPQIATLLSVAKGTSIVTEDVWDNRFKYVEELSRMGANIQVDGKIAVIEGVEKLMGAPVRACDLRAGAALIIAGLAADGITQIEGIHHIERGYENIVEKLSNLGARIKKVVIKDEPDIEKAI